MTTLVAAAHGASLAVMAAVVSACAAPRAEVDPGRAIAAATGLGEPVAFVEVGPDGAALDEPDGAGATLSLADALRRAVATDPSIQAALARVRIAMADADQSRLLPNPILSMTLRWGPSDPQIEASLAQDLIGLLQRPRAASAADHRLRMAAADAVTTALDTASQVQERYIEAQAAAALVPILRERNALLDRVRSVANARREAGEGTRDDVVVLDAQSIELGIEIEQAQLAERDARLRLARLIGEPTSAATWSLDAWDVKSGPILPERAWIDAALVNRPEVQSILWRLSELGDDAALARGASWEGAEVGVDVTREDGTFAGPSASTPLPVFDVGQARRARVTAEQFEARHELTRVRRQVVEEVRLAHMTMTASAASLARIRGELEPLQRQRRELAERAYRSGHSDVTSLYLAEQDLKATQANAIEVETRAALARIRLLRAVGGAGAFSLLAPRPAGQASVPRD